MKFIIACLLCVFAVDLAAASVTATCTFNRRTPAAGVVWIANDSSAEPSAFSIDQVGKEFSQRVVFAPKGSSLTFTNSDTVQHNAFANQQQDGVSFDLGMGDPGSELGHTITWEDGVFVRVGCRIHPKMMCWIGSISSSYATELSFDPATKSGTAVIAESPETAVQIRLWLPGYDPVSADLSSGQTLELEITRKGKPQGTCVLTME